MGRSGSKAAAAVALALIVAACGGASQHQRTVTRRAAATTPARTPTTTHVRVTTTVAKPTPPPVPKPPPPPAYPQLLPAATATAPTPLVPAVRWQGQTAAWVERAPGITTILFDQRLVTLHLHSGTIDAGTLGWRYGPQISAGEAPNLVAAFNGGFRLSTGSGGFESYGRYGAPLRPGLASIVTYSDGTTDVGSWRQEVPAPAKQVVSVRQNLTLLIDHGVPAGNVGCDSCWGATLGGVSDPARSALGITASGQLVWVGGENLTVSQLTDALLAQHAVRAEELDINPEWVAGYFYGHRGGSGPLAPVPALASQNGIPGQFLAPWSRDFFSITAR